MLFPYVTDIFQPITKLTANWKVILNCQKGKMLAWATSRACRRVDFAS